MIRHYSLILCIAAVTLTGCQNQKTVSSSNEVKQMRLFDDKEAEEIYKKNID